MTRTPDQEVHAHAQKIRGELEILRGEVRKLQGEARLQADQRANLIADQIEELERRTEASASDIQEKADDVTQSLQTAWVEIADTIHRGATADIKHQLQDKS